MKIGFISGTGPQGKGIALRWALAGRDIFIGSRTKEKAESACKELNDIIGKEKIIPLTNEEMLKECEIVLLTVPYEYAIKTVETYLDLIREKTRIFVDVTVPMEYQKGKGMLPVRPEEGSGAQAIKKVLGDVSVVGAFKTQSAEELMAHEEKLNQDNFICGPKEHRGEIMELSKEIEGLRPINSGPLREATVIEPMVPFLININRRYKLPKGTGAGFTLTGLDS
ncbi:MAG: NADPH-dependent F420 reductase [Candidatus Hodarchaeales archaeon]